ncbi:MAG: MotA/TolQ/ExbB proton channel family protein, partial [Xanthomonadaceae bacterium]|nr:MotA/TolQ/ExbB proton channel family protein [Xanthomonadaceae bacterium]
AAAAAPPPPAPQVDLADAYRREFAFLEAQKRELGARLAQTRTAFEADRARLEREVDALEGRVLAARTDTDALNEQLAAAERREEAAVEGTELLAGTLSQAQASLALVGQDYAADTVFQAANDAEKLATLLGAAQRKLAELSSVRREQGTFFLPDGTEVSGTIVRIGAVAALGMSDRGSGVLAPAGDGRFKLWNVPAADAAEALAAGRTPPVLKAYVFESTATAVEPPIEKTFWGEMAKGGAIGWVILALGALGLLLIAVRAVFLQRAGAAVDKIMDAVSPLVRAQRVPEAIEACKRFKGSAARVVTAALRNADREREHLEDIVSESILHESTHLNRFGAFITTITAVAPLLGLLGTVTGMIQTFDVITEFGNSDPKMLSGGIAVALVTTMQGLMVAIPLLVIGSLLNGWADGLKDDMEKAALKVINLYQETRAAVAKPRAA